MKCYCVVLLTTWPWPLIFDLETCRHCCHWVGNLPANFGVSRTFRSRLIGQHLLDASRDLATFTLTLEVTALVADKCVSLNFVGLPVRKILGIYCVSINPPGTLTYESQNSYHFWYIQISSPTPSLNTLGSFVFELCCGHTDRQTNRLTRKSYPRRPTESARVTIFRLVSDESIFQQVEKGFNND